MGGPGWARAGYLRPAESERTYEASQAVAVAARLEQTSLRESRSEPSGSIIRPLMELVSETTVEGVTDTGSPRSFTTGGEVKPSIRRLLDSKLAVVCSSFFETQMGCQAVLLQRIQVQTLGYRVRAQRKIVRSPIRRHVESDRRGYYSAKRP